MTEALLQLADLTLPHENTQTLRAVLNSYFRKVIQTFVQFPAEGLGPEAKELYERTVSHVQRVLRGHPALVVSVLRRPSHAALLWSALSRLEADQFAADRWMTELCLLIHFELAVQGGALSDSSPFMKPEDGWWPVLRSTSANLEIQLSPDVGHISFRSGELHVHHRETIVVPLRGQRELPDDLAVELTCPYFRIANGVLLALSDNNPEFMDEALPEGSGHRVDLGGHPVEEWVEALRASFELVDQFLPLIGEEMRLLLRLVLPVGPDGAGQFSASFPEAVGAAYMTFHPSLMVRTEMLIKEFQHSKINAAFHLDPLLENAFLPLDMSPMGSDPRTPYDLLLEVHAIQPIAKLYELMTAAGHPESKSESFQRRFREILRTNNANGQTVLKGVQPTAVGRKLFEELRALVPDQSLEGSPGAAERAERA